MLRLININKIYKASSNEVKALNNVTINFRKNEFVSILGPSGSGKTTLLNIVGGLDKYTSGDLIIAGRSTKNFKDRDWDFYRNQRIGFIFQSYNLIPHQNVLSNVELALTISGISKNERIERAKEALDKVGLSDQYYKKPNQLSGGQCQRVAIARALVNNPEILLADEPTGALDTKTSEQIMALIKEISKDRLVIMVTHNPDLAERYSSRIIRLLDGQIVEDNNPFLTEQEVKEVEHLDEAQKVKTSKAKMGLLTANKLSFKNLVSKKGRTLLVSIASSIGIIGVSTVLAVSFGVSNYVTDMQDDMLSSYPIQIAEQSLDTSTLFAGLSNDDKKELAQFDVKTQLGMSSMIEYLMDKYADLTKFATNDINENLVNYVKEIPQEYLSAVQYDYGIDVTNNIFTNWTSSETENFEKKWMSLNGLTQRYISELETVHGFSRYATFVNLFTNFMHEMPGDEEYITSQYDMLGDSKFANNENEIMLVVNKDHTITDLMLGQMGYYAHDNFIQLGQRAVDIYMRGTASDKSDWGLRQRLEDDPDFTQADYDRELAKLDEKYHYDDVKIVNYTDLIGKELYYLPHSELWNYDEEVSSDTVMEGGILFFDSNYIYNLTYDSTYAKINGENGLDILSGDCIDINNPSNSKKVMFCRAASDSRDPNTFFDDKTFKASLETFKYIEKYSWFEINSVADVIENYRSNPLSVFTGNALIVETQNKRVTTYSNVLLNPNPSPTAVYEEGVGSNVVVDASVSDAIKGYSYQVNNQDIASNPKAMKMTVTGILIAKDDTNFGSLSRGVYYNSKFAQKYMNDANASDSAIVNDTINGFKASFNNGKALTSKFGAYCKYSFIDYDDQDHPVIDDSGYAYALNGDLSNSIASMFSSFLGGSTASNTNVTYLRALSGLRADLDESGTHYDFNNLPDEISIYPKDFNSKDKVTEYLDRWNSEETLTVAGTTLKKSERSDLSYSDTVAMIINVINSLITIVTGALIAFTSLSLVVSCFMIAVITYISVMERVKEIGVIRSLGGRKKDVSRLFTAENFMTGLASGAIGIVITYLLSLIINVIIYYFGAPSIAKLPWWMALLMILLAILLNVISGFIPSLNAAKQDPVNALRSE